jgi:hypothetical protein
VLPPPPPPPPPPPLLLLLLGWEKVWHGKARFWDDVNDGCWGQSSLCMDVRMGSLLGKTKGEAGCFSLRLNSICWAAPTRPGGLLPLRLSQ